MSKLQPILYPIIKWWHKNPKYINHIGIRLKLYPTVFHPILYGSTNVFLNYAKKQNLANKNVLELGAGSGFFTFYLAKNFQTKAFASDINPKAVIGLKENNQSLNLNVKVYHSNLFDDIPPRHFDYIFINPPYYQGTAKTADELAFYAGDSLQYFQKLFSQLSSILFEKCFMILSENSPNDKILEIATLNNVKFKLKETIVSKGEKFLIYFFE